MNSSSKADRFYCSCGKEYRWKPEIAGRKAKCGCGKVVAIPTERPGADQDTYDLNDPPPLFDVAPTGPVDESYQPPVQSLVRAGTDAPVRQSAGAGIDWKNVDWKGVGWVVFAAAMFFGLAIWHIVDPHRPTEEGRRTYRTNLFRSFSNFVYDIGGNGLLVALYLFIALLFVGSIYFVIREPKKA